MLIDGKGIAEELRQAIRNKVQEANLHLRLAIVLIGDDPATAKFIVQKKKFAEAIGVDVRVYDLPADISTTALREKIAEVSHLKTNDGVIVQLPLPPHIRTQYVLNGVPPKKDVDVLSLRSAGGGVLSPVVGAVKEILDRHDVEVEGKHVVVLGAGLLVGRPVAHWLIDAGATVTVVNEHTLKPSDYTLSADIIVTGVGKRGTLTAEMVKDGTVVIDVAGDATPEVEVKAALFTPTPGGVGPITVAKLFENLVILNT